MTKEQITDFEKVQSQVQSLYEEVSLLAKKKHTDAINEFKLQFINQTINDANRILGANYKPYSNFDQFDEVVLPNNSDVTMILGQYLNCLETLRGENIEYQNYNFEGYDWYWKNTKMRTGKPKKMK
jgi:hypothetical protein